MCGIAAVVWREAQSVTRTDATLSALVRRLRHRGPDGAGQVGSEDGRFGVGSARLAVRDLSPAGALPFITEAGKLAITYNGELYNAAELRADLEALGHGFRSHNDAEVVVRGYAQWGTGLPARLRGMFAFAIMDQRTTPSLFIARDPLGIKPLYYALTADALLIASELNALRATGLVSAEIDQSALRGFLLLGSVPAPHTIYRQVHVLEAGCAALITSPARVSALPYWELPAQEEACADVAGHTARSLEDAVRSHLVSDVPVGAFLSGGLDSSSVVALMAGVTGTSIRTCSLAFEDRGFDESAYAAQVAQAFGTDHYQKVLTERAALAGLSAAFAAMDQPSIDGLNSYYVSQVAREAGLKVVLSGLGGDELFGGYESTFNGVPRLLRIQRLSRALPGAAAAAAASVESLSQQQRWRKVAEALQRGPAPAAAYVAFRGLFTAAEANALQPDADGGFDAQDYVASRSGPLPDARSRASIKAWVARAELRSYTTNQLLRDTDIMSMAHSIEVRVPLLDTRLVEAVLRLPAAQRFAGGGAKPLLRSIMAPLLPAAVRERTRKQGFVLPLDRWLRRGALAETLEWRSAIFDSFDPGALTRLRADFAAGRVHWSRVWALSALAGWHAGATRTTDS